MNRPEISIAQVEPYQPQYLTQDPSLKRQLEQAVKFARKGEPICLIGETGVGKSWFVRDLYGLSPRDGELVMVQGPSVQENLFESELFGHVKGAFTGASSDRVGLIETAHKGMLFLDEIGDLSMRLQVKLLTAVQDGVIRRVGESKERSIDVQWVTATNADLVHLIGDGKFRSDLYFRLCSCTVHIPPLRERTGDVLLLAQHFVRQLEGDPEQLTADTRERLEQYSWPGNIRELQHVIRRGLILADGGAFTPDCLQLNERLGKAVANAKSGKDPGIRVGHSLETAKLLLYQATVEHCGNQADAAAMLGIGRCTLSKFLKKHQNRSDQVL